jgi:hypothetical protein
LPYQLPGFGYVCSRVIPFIWAAALLRVPERMPRAVAMVLGASALLYCVGQSADLFRLERDAAAFTAGVPQVPEGARLLTLNFRPRVTSKNPWSLQHASGFYVIDRMTTAQDVWADSPTMPITFRDPPDLYADGVRIRRFINSAASVDVYCGEGYVGARFDACKDEFRAAWDDFWRGADGRFDRVILWGASDDVRATVPSAWQAVFQKDALIVLAHR